MAFDDSDRILSLVALPVNGRAAQYDDIPMAPGIHLRWFFHPQAGFPPGGFLVRRRRYPSITNVPEFPGPGRWEDLIHLKYPVEISPPPLPPSPGPTVPNETTFDWLEKRLSGAFSELYRPETAAVQQMFSRLKEVPTHYEAWLSNLGRTRPGLRVMDALLVASLDPSIARLLGLYYVDSSLLPGQTVDYEVEGYWGRNPWPFETLDFNAVPAETIHTGSLKPGPVHMMTFLVPSLEKTSGGLQYLNLVGSAANLTFTVSFDRPVREIILNLYTPFTDAGWKPIQAGIENGSLIPSGLEIEIEPQRIAVRCPTPMTFLQMETRGAANLAIRSILYRPRYEPIGTLTSPVVRLCHSDSYYYHLPTDETSALRVRSKPVQALPLDFLRRSEVPPTLNETGEVQDGRANVELVFGSPAQLNNGEIDTSQPVRLRVGYTQTSPVSNHPLTAAFPRVGPLWDLIAFWPLNNRYQSLNGAPVLEKLGQGEFQPFWNDVPEAYEPREFVYGIPNGAGGALKAQLPALNQLGTHLLLQIWIQPEDTASAFQVLISNHQNQSFCLGLHRQNNLFYPRFYVNGNGPFDAPRALRTNDWNHIAVLYDGKTIRFYLDGQLNHVANAMYGPVAPSARNFLSLGADPLPAAIAPSTFEYPYFGKMADVQIWRGAFPNADVTHPSFLAGWSFAGSVNEMRSGNPLGIRGSATHPTGHPQQLSRQVLELDGSSYLELRAVPGITHPGRRLTMQTWVYPDPVQDQSTMISGGSASSFWFGLVQQGGMCRLAVRINGFHVVSDPVVPLREWSHVTIGVDGEQVVFYANGRSAGRGIMRYGRINRSIGGLVCFGADVGSQPGAQLLPFRGRLADFHCWSELPGLPSPGVLTDWQTSRRTQMSMPQYQAMYAGLRAAWSLEGRPYELVSATEGQTGNLAEMVFEPGHPEDSQRLVARFPGSAWINVTDLAIETFTYSGPLTLRAAVNPEAEAAKPMTVLSNDGKNCFALVLKPEGSAYRPALLLSSTEYACPDGPDGPGTIPAGTWTRLKVMYRKSEIIFRLNGRNLPALDGPLTWFGENPDNRIAIGAEVSGTLAGTSQIFRGRMADVEIWSPDPDHPDAPLPSTLALQQPASFIARSLPTGSYIFRMAGIDLFGRVSQTQQGRIELGLGAPPPAPAGARARFLPTRLPITGVERIENPEDHDGATHRITIRETALYNVNLERHDAEIVPSAQADSTNAGSQPVDIVRMKYEPVPGGGRSTLRGFSIHMPPFGRIPPDLGERHLLIADDYHMQATWTWTGTQRLFAPSVLAFNLYERHAIRLETPENEPQREKKTDWKPLPGAAAVPLRDEIFQSHNPHQVLEAAAVSHMEWLALTTAPDDQKDKEVIRWLPEPPLNHVTDGSGARELRLPAARLYKITLNSTDRPPAGILTVEGFVPGALVGYNLQPDAQAWQHYQVVWHEWSEPDQWVLYFVQNQTGQHSAEAAQPLPPRLQLIRYYPGQRYTITTELPERANYAPEEAGAIRPVGTVHYEIAVTALNEYDQESTKSSPASLIAVDRRRPPKPPAPMVVITRPNYNGQSLATLTFDLIDSSGNARARYLIYRATDSAIFNRDLEQRRCSQDADFNRRQPGAYSGLSAQEIMSDDPDFLLWLRARFPNWIDRWQRDLFVPRQEVPTETASTEARAAWNAWNAATPVWQAWADRFYPSLTDAQFQAIAERSGNEAAFGLVNSAPYEPAANATIGTYVDQIPGTVRNRYIYRLRAQSRSLLSSTGWGLTSIPQTVDLQRAPRQPVFTRVEAGDRSVTLHWALNREPNFKEYRLYRVVVTREEVEGRTLEDRRILIEAKKNELMDLRWDPPLLDTIPDPRLVVSGNTLSLPLEHLPAGLVIAQVTGVYRSKEYPAPTPNPLGIRPYNHFNHEPGSGLEQSRADLIGDRWEIANLRPMADGTAVMLEVRDTAGETRVIEFLGEGPLYKDKGLLGLTDYYYRLVAVNKAGNFSSPSDIVNAKAVDLQPPLPPMLTEVVWIADGELAKISISWQSPEVGTNIMVQRKSASASSWRNVSGWIPNETTTFVDSQVNPYLSYTYRLKANNYAGILNETFFEIDIANLR